MMLKDKVKLTLSLLFLTIGAMLVYHKLGIELAIAYVLLAASLD